MEEERKGTPGWGWMEQTGASMLYTDEKQQGYGAAPILFVLEGAGWMKGKM